MPGCLPASFSSFHWSWLLSYGKTFNNKCNTSDVNYFVSFILKKFRFSPLVSLYCGVESPEARDAQNDHTLVLPTLLYLLSQYRINCGAYGLNQSYYSLTYIFSVLIPVVTAEGRLVAFSTMAQRAPKFHGTKVIPPLDFSLPESIPYLKTDWWKKVN